MDVETDLSTSTCQRLAYLHTYYPQRIPQFDNSFTRNYKGSRKSLMFFFLGLPIIAAKIVIREMNAKQRILLALTSKRMEEYVRLAKITIPLSVVYFRERCSFIELKNEKLYLLCDKGRLMLEEGKDEIRKNTLKPWMKENSGSLLEDTLDILQRVLRLFLCNEIELAFDTDYKNKTTVKEVLGNPTLQKWKRLTYHCNQITSEDMNLIMDMARSDRSICVGAEEVPLDFRHANAFKSWDNMFEDARWVRIEDLFVLRNSNKVLIGKNNFNGAQLKTFIDYWVNCEFDVFRWMKITRNPGIELDEIIEGLLVLEYSEISEDSDKMFFTFAKTTSESRKNTTLHIISTPDDIYLNAFPPAEPFQINGIVNEECEKAYDILKILERKQFLETMLKNNKLYELSEVEKQEIEKIPAEIGELEGELREFNVEFRNGRAIVFL